MGDRDRAVNRRRNREEAQRAELAREQAARAAAQSLAKRLQAIQYVTDAALTRLPLNDLLRELLRRIRRVLSADNAAILLLTEDRRYLVVMATDGLEEEVAAEVRVPIGRGIAGRIAERREPMIVSDMSQVEVWSPILRERVRSLIGTPLIVEDRLIGILHVDSVEPNHFGEDDLRLIQLVTDRVAALIERARAEEALRRSEERFRATFEQAAVGMAQVALDGRWLRVNQKLCDIVGHSWEELTQRTFQEITYPEDLEAELGLLRRLTAGERQTYSLEKRYVRKDGSLVWANVTVSMVHDGPGSPDYLIAVVEDIQRRKNAEEERERLLEEVQRRAAELDATIAAIADGVVIYGPDGQIVRVNDTAGRVLGYPPEARLQTMAHWTDRIRVETPEGRPIAPEETPGARALRGEMVRGMVMVLHPPGGKRIWISSSAAPICAPGGYLLGAIVTFSDITALHELQEQREDLVRMVSHDLRNPLTAVQGQAQLLARLLERSGQDGALRRSAEAIFTSSRRMNSMIQDLVDMARIESLEIRLNRVAVQLRPYLTELKQRLAGVLETERIRVEIPEDLPPIWADPDRLERVLTNLLSNALKYSDPSTSVLVTAEGLPGEVKVSVSDQGIGISPEDLPHIFERYYRAKGARKAEGLGLGLYITRMLVEAMGGRIWAESQVGKGSTFSFTLPVATTQDQSPGIARG